VKPTLKAPGSRRLKLKYDRLLSNFAFNFNLRRHNLFVRIFDMRHVAAAGPASPSVGRCRLTQCI